MQQGLEPMIYHTRDKHTNPILVFLTQPGLEPMIYQTRDKHTNTILLSFWPNQGLNPWSTTHETSTLTQFYSLSLMQPGLEPMIYHTRDKHTNQF
jgi:hypothetical protein